MIEWNILSFSDSTPLESKLQLLDDFPAIYAFHMDLQIDARLDADGWFDELSRKLSLPHGARLRIPLGFYEVAEVNHSSFYGPSYLTKDKLQQCVDCDADFVSNVSKLLKMLEDSVPPLYVGETGELKRRVHEHLFESDGLLRRFEHHGLDRRDVRMRYGYLKDLDITLDFSDGRDMGPIDDDDIYAQALSADDDDVFDQSKPSKQLLFVEELITRLLRPRFIEKIGENKLPKEFSTRRYD